MVFLDRYGWPVERIRGRWITNLIRLAIHTRSIISNAEWMHRAQRNIDRATNGGNACRLTPTSEDDDGQDQTNG